jgi:hypothetical protein
MNQIPPSPRKFRIFRKFRGEIRKGRCTTGINNIGIKFAISVNNTGGTFAAGVNYTGGKFAIVNNKTKGKILSSLPLVLLIPMPNNGNNIRLLTS